MDPRLKEYVSAARKLSLKDEVIKSRLLKAGWDRNTVLAALQRPKTGRKKLKRVVTTIEKTLVLLILLAFTLYVLSFLWSYFSTRDELYAKLDNARLNDFQNLSSLINDYYSLNKRLPEGLKDVDPGGEYSIDDASGLPYEYSLTSQVTFDICGIFSLDNTVYSKGNVCFPYELNASGVFSQQIPFNPSSDKVAVPPEKVRVLPTCTNPEPLLEVNARCSENPGNCRREQYRQEFGMSSVVISNLEERVAQTISLPDGYETLELTEFSPFIIEAKGDSACMQIYAMNNTDPVSGVLLYEYLIDIGDISPNTYHTLNIEPIILEKGNNYGIVFSLLDEKSELTFARGLEMSSYNYGSASYWKRPDRECSEECEQLDWLQYEDDIKFYLLYY